MQNLKNIKSLNENQIDLELEQIVKYFTVNKFGSSYINEFQNVCNKFLLNGDNKTININDVNKFEKDFLNHLSEFKNNHYLLMKEVESYKMNIKRKIYILGKWETKGIWESGNNIIYGWFIK